MGRWLALTRHNNLPLVVQLSRIALIEPSPNRSLGSLVYLDPSKPIAVKERYDTLIGILDWAGKS